MRNEFSAERLGRNSVMMTANESSDLAPFEKIDFGEVNYRLLDVRCEFALKKRERARGKRREKTDKLWQHFS